MCWEQAQSYTFVASRVCPDFYLDPFLSLGSLNQDLGTIKELKSNTKDSKLKVNKKLLAKKRRLKQRTNEMGHTGPTSGLLRIKIKEWATTTRIAAQSWRPAFGCCRGPTSGLVFIKSRSISERPSSRHLSRLIMETAGLHKLVFGPTLQEATYSCPPHSVSLDWTVWHLGKRTTLVKQDQLMQEVNSSLDLSCN